MESIHNALHAVFGAAVSIALGYSLKFSSINDIMEPSATLIFAVSLAVSGEMMRVNIQNGRPCWYPGTFSVGGVLLYVLTTASLIGFKDGVISLKPEPAAIFIAYIMVMWSVSLAVAGFLQREFGK